MLTWFVFHMAGCATWRLALEPAVRDTQVKALQEALEEKQTQPVSKDVLDYLTPEPILASESADHSGQETFQVAAQEVDAKTFFGSLIQETPYNLAIHPKVQGSITLNLKNVTLADVLQTVSDLYGFDIQEKNKVIYVYPADLTTEYFSLNYLTLIRHGRSRTSVNSGRLPDNQQNGNTSTEVQTFGQEVNSTSIETSTNADFWEEIRQSLQTLIPSGNGRLVTISPQAGMITIRAYPSELRGVRHFLANIERQIHKQVALEARIIEVNLDKQYQQGIQWDKISVSDGISIQSLVSLPALTSELANDIGGGVAMTVNKGSFEAIIQLLGAQGEVNTLSSPRVTALNNQKAVIKVGSDEYFVTDVSTTTVTSTSTTTTPEVELTPFFSGIALDVTPQIDDHDQVLLHVHPSVITVEEQTKQIDLGSFGAGTLELPLAKSNIRESDTIVRARSGDIVVIGGLMKHEQTNTQTQVPFLASIPFLGEFFKNREETSSKIELVILLRPTVVKYADDWRGLMKDSLRHLQALKFSGGR